MRSHTTRLACVLRVNNNIVNYTDNIMAFSLATCVHIRIVEVVKYIMMCSHTTRLDTAACHC